MGLPHFETCCCGCTLRTGVMIIGIVDAVAATATMILSILNSIALNTVGNAGALEEYRETLYAMFVTYAVFSSIYLTISILLVVGASKGKPGLLVPWLVYVCIYVVLTIVSIIINTTSYVNAGEGAFAYSYMISGIIGICILFYFFLIVKSLHTNLKNPTVIDPYPSQPSYPNFARNGA